MNIIFTLTGKAGCGKDTVSAILAKYANEKEATEHIKGGAFKLAYGDYLKTLCARNFGYDDSNKEENRVILQAFGTDVVRSIDENFWVGTVWNTIDTLKDIYSVFVISDARFENELKPFPWKMGYVIFNVYIDREFDSKLIDETAGHSSEIMANNVDQDKYDFIINNNGSLEDLEKTVKEMYDYVLNVYENAQAEIDKIDEVSNDGEDKQLNQ